MHPKVILTINRGPMDGQEYTFREPTICVVGRAPDCYPMLSGDDLVSRHHCRLMIDPPQVWVRDLRSLNGTYVNGVKLSSNGVRESPLHDGDEIELGFLAIRVKISHDDAEPASPDVGAVNCPEEHVSVGLA